MQTPDVAEYIVSWLKTYVEKSGLNGFTIGVSGGIDSAVTSTLCARTGKRVLAVNMPIFQAKDQVSRASGHIAWLTKSHDNVTGIDMELTPVFEQIQTHFPKDIQDNLTMANTRSRLRMMTLYAFASHHRMLVAGTGNRVEDFGVGFFTKYGDGGVDISPIADLMKSQVYALGQFLNISQTILTAPPTDGLWADDRTDESQIGATYAELEWAMTYLDSQKNFEHPQDPRLDSRQKEVLSIYKRFNRANRHKMEPIPVCKIPSELKG
ncbi:MAG: NAD(+) synthase [Proteobacteria bacterium]|nr:NAD(+) synthase [Desulfobacula sp.]MBU3952825.1 NAD(+) synthase [Pseudomonadota bacterium]MBU4131069.1 NAD(+) synthase [Pseudomonadota bacterium]